MYTYYFTSVSVVLLSRTVCNFDSFFFSLKTVLGLRNNALANH